MVVAITVSMTVFFAVPMTGGAVAVITAVMIVAVVVMATSIAMGVGMCCRNIATGPWGMVIAPTAITVVAILSIIAVVAPALTLMWLET